MNYLILARYNLINLVGFQALTYSVVIDEDKNNCYDFNFFVGKQNDIDNTTEIIEFSADYFNSLNLTPFLKAFIYLFYFDLLSKEQINVGVNDEFKALVENGKADLNANFENYKNVANIDLFNKCLKCFENETTIFDAENLQKQLAEIKDYTLTKRKKKMKPAMILREKTWYDLKTLFSENLSNLNLTGLYFIKNKTNNKIYIGQAQNIYNRVFGNHFTKAGVAKNPNFAADYNTNSADFIFAYLICPEDELDATEFLYINYYNTFKDGYNETPGNYTNAVHYFKLHRNFKANFKFWNLNAEDDLKTSMKI